MSLEELASSLASMAFVHESPRGYLARYVVKCLPDRLGSVEKLLVAKRVDDSLRDFEELHRIYGAAVDSPTSQACLRYRALSDAFLYFLEGRGGRGA